MSKPPPFITRVWDLELPHAEKVVLAALAWNADEHGENVRPSIKTVAQRVSWSERQVRKVIDGLIGRQVLEVVGHHAIKVNGGRATGYIRVFRINLAAAKPLPPYESERVDADSKPCESEPICADSQL